MNRRDFLTVATTGSCAALAAPGFAQGAATLVKQAAGLAGGRSDQDLAEDEKFWRPVQQAYTVDRNWINLNNGGVSPSPRIVQEAMKRSLDQAHTAPSHVLWKLQEPKKEQVRTGLARLFGCSREEIAITRNASEALETVILGLDLEAGDEVVATDHNYPRMLNAWRQRELRDGIRLVTFPVPTNPSSSQELIDRYERAITPATRVIEVCQVTNLNGQIYPIKEICRMGREKGIEVIVDGAHAFAHFPFKHEDLDCDYYGTSLHKWLCAAHGTGFLFVRKEKIGKLWALMPPPDARSDDIRKFEEIGTHPAANHNAISEAITFHLGIGPARKAARLRHLQRRWMPRVVGRKGTRVLTNDQDDHSCGIRLLDLPGINPHQLSTHLFDAHGIITAPIVHRTGQGKAATVDFQGIRVTPHVYTTLDEIDRFADAIREVQDKGLPS